jgi:hypothetical protein
MPQDLRDAADASDAEVEATLAGLIPPPEKPYNPKVVTALANAVSAVAKVMGVRLTPESYTGPVEELDPTLVRFLAMADAAAKDYGSPLPVALENVKGDRELIVLTVYLDRLAKDADFKAFLNMPIPEEEGEETEVKVKPGNRMSEASEGGKEDFDFASRMR